MYSTKKSLFSGKSIKKLFQFYSTNTLYLDIENLVLIVHNIKRYYLITAKPIGYVLTRPPLPPSAINDLASSTADFENKLLL